MNEIIDSIGNIPFSIFYEKYLEGNNGNYSKINAQGIWLSMNEIDREMAFIVISQLPKLKGMHPDKYLQIIRG